MKNGFLFEALNHLSDEHIAEAVTYKANAKQFPSKKARRIAACVGIVSVCAIGIAVFSKNGFSKPSTTVSMLNPEYTIENSQAAAPPLTSFAQAESYQSTTENFTQAGNNNILTGAPPVEVTTQKSTSASGQLFYPPTHPNAPLSGCTLPEVKYGTFTYNGIEYGFLGIPIDKSKCTKLGNVTVSSAKDEIFSIDGYSKDFAVAVKLESSSNLYLYLNFDFSAKDLGSVLNAVDFRNLDYDFNRCTLYTEGNSVPCSTGVAVGEALTELLKSSSSAPLNSVRSLYYNKELVQYDFSALGVKCYLYISDNGYVYFEFDGSEVLAFDVGESKCKEFIETFKTGSCDYSQGMTMG